MSEQLNVERSRRRSVTPEALAAAVTDRGVFRMTAPRAFSILLGLEARGVVECEEGGFWRLTEYGVEVARDLAQAIEGGQA